MASLNEVQFDGSEEEDDFAVIPAGEYAAQIIASEMKETKAGTGMFLELRVQLLEEPYVGRLVFERLNLVNPNEVAVKIAKRSFKELCDSIGLDHTEVEDSEELHGREFIAVIKVDPPRGDWGESNSVKKYKEA